MVRAFRSFPLSHSGKLFAFFDESGAGSAPVLAHLIDERAIRLIERLDGFADRRIPSAWLVGGSVRDLILNEPVDDYDFCTVLLPGQVAEALPDLQVIETGLQHGTVTVIAWGLVCEVTTLREEGAYSDKRHPDQVHFVSDLHLDLARRDFTMNAIAWHPDCGITDPFDGQEDLRLGLIRSVGDPVRRFDEDALRLLRALRFSAQLDFVIEEKTAEAMKTSYQGLHSIARERIIAECRRTMAHQAFSRLWLDWPMIWDIVFPQLARVLRGVSADLADEPTVLARYRLRRELLINGYDAAWPELMRFVFLLRPLAGESISWQQEAVKRLRLPKSACNQLVTVAAALRDKRFWLGEGQSDAAARHGLRRWGDLWELILLLAAKLAANDPWLPSFLPAAAIQQLINDTTAVLQLDLPYSLRQLAINGQDLIRIGMKSGPRLGICLNKLLNRVIDGTLRNEREALLEAARIHFQ